MYASSQLLLQDLVHQLVPLDPAQAAKRGTLDLYPVVAFPALRGAGVSGMQAGFIFDLDTCRAKTGPQRCQHSFRSVHPARSSSGDGRADTLTHGSDHRKRSGAGTDRSDGNPLPESICATMMRP